MIVNNIEKYAKETIKIQSQAILELDSRINDDFIRSCELILKCKGKLVVSGIGKSGHIGKKLAATFASTGTPAFFLHPSEGLHGDLGMVAPGDVVILISYSGSAAEFKTMVPLFKAKGIPIISMTGDEKSFLGNVADAVLNIHVDREACPLGLAPTASATATLVLGDALAISVMRSRGFSEQDYAASHPGGALGARLLLRNSDIIDTELPVPIVQRETPFRDALRVLSSGSVGLLAVMDNSQLNGVFTDGDLRRAIDIGVSSTAPIWHLMNHNPVWVSADGLALETLNILHNRNINAVPVIDSDVLKGVITTHQIYKAGVR